MIRRRKPTPAPAPQDGPPYEISVRPYALTDEDMAGKWSWVTYVGRSWGQQGVAASKDEAIATAKAWCGADAESRRLVREESEMFGYDPEENQ